MTDRSNGNILIKASFLFQDLYHYDEMVYDTKYFDTELYKRRSQQMFDRNSNVLDPGKAAQVPSGAQNPRLRYLGK
ncbi:MAG: hypothetical protein ACMUEM_03970 [Flavobacteriales bacterium AspAUS03]